MNWGFISQKTAFFIVTAVKTSNLTYPEETCSSASLSTTDTTHDFTRAGTRVVWQHFKRDSAS
jgi:hypothetical protein